MFDKIKKQVPNILSASRIAVAPFVPFIFMGKNIIFTVGTILATSLTDFLDGKLARRWGAESLNGEKLDALSDKVFFGSTLASAAILINPIMWVPFAMEGIIAAIGALDHLKNKDKSKTAYIGKVKMWPLAGAVFYLYLLG